jgi:hypothetical protein
VDLLDQRKLGLRARTVALLRTARLLPVPRQGRRRRVADRLLAALEKPLEKSELLLKGRWILTAQPSELLRHLANLIVETVVLSLQEVGDLTKLSDVVYVIDLKHERKKSQRKTFDNPFPLELLR